MLPKVKEAFIMEKEYQKECEISCQATVDGYTDFIFINRFGGVQHQGTLNKALRRIIRDCNYEILDNAKGKEAVTLPRFSNHLPQILCSWHKKRRHQLHCIFPC